MAVIRHAGMDATEPGVAAVVFPQVWLAAIGRTGAGLYFCPGP